MVKIIQPISNPDEIREEAAAAVKEQYADYYVNAPAPDPLDFHPSAQAKPTPEEEITELSNQNDPLKDA